ncbi:RNA polymerase sigma factor SigI [Peribacillus saganii]|uniref:RNA polymerase sigma factor SigI n=1 Tax=Peribacillus saganii TaxID=2303992 RepID=A0A372LS16_9BACI|nr:RNA polymerase sigma factor SigI [Peribacillus saganii]RFU70985.1 RNA polymerase sigma factor SigI [Peribacillus saganii]
MFSMLFTPLKRKRNIEDTVLKIQAGNKELREEILVSFKPFIAKTVSSVCRRYITESDDEFSIGLIAFNDAIDKFVPAKGHSLLAFAETIIKRRVIDYLRSQSRKQDVLLDYKFEDEQELSESYLETEKSMQQFRIVQDAEKRKDEILLYQNKLLEFDLVFDDLAENSPKHEDARRNAISIARLIVEDAELRGILFEKKRLPVKQLEQRVKVSRKTIERNRKYIIAISVILHGEFFYLKDYIKGVLEE